MIVPATLVDLVDLAVGGPGRSSFEVAYEGPGRGRVIEAMVARVRNGISANYLEPYMRRRDPDCMTIADDLPTDKPRYPERFGQDFAVLRAETSAWLAGQDLAVFGFHAGGRSLGVDAMVVAPANAGWSPEAAAVHFDSHAPDFEIEDSAGFVLGEIQRLRRRYPKLLVAPLFYRVHEGMLYQILED